MSILSVFGLPLLWTALITWFLFTCGFSFSAFAPALPILYFLGVIIMTPKDDCRFRIVADIIPAVIVIVIVAGMLVSVLK